MKRIINFIIGVFVTVFLVWFLLKQVSTKDVVIIFNKLSILAIIIAFTFYVFSFIVRSFKYKILLKELDIKKIFKIVCINNMMVSILPARTGELSFIYLVKKAGLRGTKAASALIISRIFDFVAILLLLLFSIIFIEKIPPTIRSAVHIIAFFVLLLMVFFLFIVYFGNLSLKALKKLIVLLNMGEVRGISFIMERVEFLLQSLHIVKIQNKFFIVLFFSIVIFFAQFLMLYTLLIGMGIKISFIHALFAINLFFILTALPLQSLVGLGTLESFWALALITVGIDKNMAISSGFVQHILLIIFFLILGLYGTIKMRINDRLINKKYFRH